MASTLACPTYSITSTPSKRARGRHLDRKAQSAWRIPLGGLISQRGVTIKDIAHIVYDLQVDYVPHITIEQSQAHVQEVLKKREVQHAVVTGIELDMAVEAGHFSPILRDIIARDAGLYGIDEILALSIVNVYGSIGLTNFGYVDKMKTGIVKELDSKTPGRVNTFIDDLVGAIAAAAAARIAHAGLERNQD